MRSSAKKLNPIVPLYHIVRDDFQEDPITKMQFVCYDDAYDELERFYGDLCCSDERIEYSIVPIWLLLLVVFVLKAWKIAVICVYHHMNHPWSRRLLIDVRVFHRVWQVGCINWGHTKCHWCTEFKSWALPAGPIMQPEQPKSRPFGLLMPSASRKDNLRESSTLWMRWFASWTALDRLRFKLITNWWLNRWLISVTTNISRFATRCLMAASRRPVSMHLMLGRLASLLWSFTSTFVDGPTASIWSTKWVVASDHQLPNLPLSQEIANNGVRGMNWLQNWLHDFDSLSTLYRLSAALSDSNHGSYRDDCSARASQCREVWASSKPAWNRFSTLNLVRGWAHPCENEKRITSSWSIVLLAAVAHCLLITLTRSVSWCDWQ